MQPTNNPRSTRAIVYLLVLLFIVIPSVAGGVFLVLRTGKTKVNVLAVPSDAAISVNNKRVNGPVYLEPGKYTISAAKDGFESSSNDVVVTKKAQDVQLILTPVSQEAIDWAQKNQDLYLKAEGVSGQQSEQEGADFEKNNPIIQFLPYKNLLFSIDYKAADNDPNRVVLIITADNSVDRAYAITQIKNWGFSASDYEISFSNFSNPFKEGR